MKALLLCDDGNVDLVSKKARELDLGIEIQAFYKPSRCKNKEDIAKHKNLIKELSPLSLHGPFGDLCPGSFDPMVRDVAMNRFNLGYSVAQKLCIKNVIFHIGWVPGAGSPTNWASRCANFWEEFLEGKDDDTYFHIENLFDKTPKVINDVVTNINSDRVKVCLDLGHVHSHSESSILEWINVFGSYISYLHIHDNNGKEDQHLGIGMGDIPMRKVLLEIERVNPDAIWALEMYPEYLDESVDWLFQEGFI